MEDQGNVTEPRLTPSAGPTREKLRKLLREGRLDDRTVEIEVSESAGPPMPMIEVFSSSGVEDMGLNIREMLGNIFPQKKKASGSRSRRRSRS